MFKREITYTDYDGVERTEEFYFNLTKTELTERELSVKGGLTTFIKNIISLKDVPELYKVFKELVLSAYGKKSPDGRRFIKSEEYTQEFEQSPAYDIMMMEFFENPDSVADFIKGINPVKDAQVDQEIDNKLKELKQ